MINHRSPTTEGLGQTLFEEAKLNAELQSRVTDLAGETAELGKATQETFKAVEKVLKELTLRIEKLERR